MSRRGGRRRGWTRAGLVLLALGAAALPGDAPATPPGKVAFDRVDLEVGGRVTEVVIHDLDGDGRQDLLVMRGREALLFFQQDGGKWPTQANQRFRFHPRTILFDVGDVDADGKAEIVLLNKDGVSAYRLRKRGSGWLYGLRPKRLARCPSFFTRPVKKEVRRKRLLRDLDRDQKLDLVVPRQDGFSILRNIGAKGKAKFAAPVLLPAYPEAILNTGRDRLSSRLFAAYWFPNPNVVQWDATGPAEVVTARDGTISVFGANKGGLPVTPRGSYDIPEQKQFSRQVENPLELDFTMPLIVSDLDGDGRVDISSTHVGQGTTRVYKNQPDAAKAFKTPARSIRVKGVTFFSYYTDMDGDKKPDLILPRVDKISVWGILKVLLTRTVPVEMLLYYQRSDGTLFPADPDATRALEVPLSINSKGDGIKFGTSVVATVDGDYDNDGNKDLLYRTGSDELSFFRGVGRKGLESDAALTVTVPSLDDYRFCLPIVRDMNADGRSDVVLRYWSWDRKGDRLTILRSKGP